MSDHVEDLERDFESRRSTYELSFTLASIAVGALTGVASAVLDLTTESFDAGAWTEIVGGVVATILGLCAFLPPDESVDFERPLVETRREFGIDVVT